MIQQSELHELEDKCIQEHAPTCMAACPLHVDVRAVTAEVSRGDFTAALKALKKTLPFPGIIGRVCDHPCQAVCKRREAGDDIAIAALERACADYGGPPEKPRVLPKRNKRVAVLGGGLSGLTAAFDLARKGYTVTVYEAAEQLGGQLLARFAEPALPRALLHTELGQAAEAGADIRLRTRLTPEALAALRREVDVVYLAFGEATGETFDLALDEHRRIQADPVTYATSQIGVFAGGSLLRAPEAYSPIRSMGDGRRAAISIDRYLQKVSLTASRVNEGAYTTRLYTSTEGIPPLPQVPAASPADGYTREEAIQEAGRCLLCECMECVKVCEYLKHYGRYPKKYVQEIYNNLSIVKGERKANTFINSCSLCGLCGEVCPNDLNMGDLNRQARQIMVEQNRMPPSAHDFALRDLQFSNSDAFALARHRPGATSSAYVFFPGCQLAGSAPQHVERTYAYLQAKLGDVGLMLGCCGAPADWAGRTDLLQATLAAWREQHQALGAPEVIVACSSCFQVFQEYLPQVSVVSLWTLMDQLGLPDAPARLPAPAKAVAIHDPCTTRYEHALQDSARAIVQRLGYAIEELPLSRDRTECCSYGGLMWFVNRDLAQAVVKRRIAASPADYVTYCAVCRDFFAAQGKRALHLLDLVYGTDLDQQAERPNPGYSQRHENRARLKRQLLQDLWGETMDQPSAAARLTLSLSADVQARLEQRLILVEDVQRVIEHAERTGRKLLNRETGHWLAYYRPTAVTYWVEYTAQGETFVIHNAYSHRMEIAEEAQR
jgi:glutamate synthase (NADPH) small chain